MDSSLFHVHQSAPVSGPVSAASVSVSASTSSIPAPLGHSLPGAGHVDAVDEDEVSLDSNASTADHHLQHHQSDPDPGAGSGAGPVAPWLANIKRRAPIACRRCRRQRSKCEHDKAKPPCKSCKEAGLGAEDCIFPVRGQPGNDREYRHPRQRAPKGSKSAANAPDAAAAAGVVEGRAAPRPRNPPNPSKLEDVWKSMPPKEDILDAVDRFTSNYFQLSFISKKQFRDKLQNDHTSVEPFLLLGILGISARMTPALIKAHGSGLKAAEYFTSKQFDIASREIYMGPTLERCQAFYLLSLAQQGSGLKNVSYLNVGIATRMSTLMQLHREETYDMQNPTVESIISAESARRTMWMLHSQDSLHSGPQSPVTLGAPDITTLLPCCEEDFVAGRQPRSRAALPDSPPAIEKPHLVRDPGRSLFASLMQIHHYWGIVSRRAASFAREPSPWDSQSEFINMKTKLDDWEDGLASEHRWSVSQLHYYKKQGLDLSYTNMTMMLRLCNILLRRPYMADMMVMYSKSVHEQAFFAGVAADMFRNVSELYEQIDAQFTGRSVNENVGAQITAFCVYVCGLFSTYACRYPNLCPDKAIVERGPSMVKRTKQILSECDSVWPLASRWVESLERTYNHPYKAPLMNEGGMTDAKDTVPQAWLKKSIPAPKIEPDTVPSPLNADITPYTNHQQPHAQMLPHQQSALAVYHATPMPPSFPPVIDMQTPTQPQAATLPYASQPHLSNLLTQQTQPPDQLYIPAHPPASDMNMMMSSPFQSAHPQPPPQPAGYMVNHAGHGYYHQGHHGPSNDGFEDELQYYMGDKDGPSLPTSWSGPF